MRGANSLDTGPGRRGAQPHRTTTGGRGRCDQGVGFPYN